MAKKATTPPKTEEVKKLKFKILALTANDKAINWQMKINATYGIVAVKNGYKLSIMLDEEYFEAEEQRIKQKTEDVKRKPDMFDDYMTTLQSLSEGLAALKDRKEELEAMDIDSFDALVSQVDFTKGVITLEIPETVVPDLIKLRHNVECFTVNLK